MASAPVLERKPAGARAQSGRTAARSSATQIAWLPVLLVTFGFIALHALCINRYGYFRDELYYISCAKRFDWGFVDQPPLSVGLLKLVAEPWGYPLWLVRVPAVLSGALAALVAALTARQLGGKTMAQVLAAALVAATPTYLVVTHLYSMNSLDVLFWAVAAWVWTGIGRNHPRLWLMLGVVLGLALMNKLSGLWLLAGLGVATLFTERRKDLSRPEPWIALFIALVGLAPYAYWQTQHDWVTPEFIRNAALTKLLPISWWMFLVRELAVMNPISWPVWLVGFMACMVKPKWRSMGLVWLTVLSILLLSGRARENYLSPAYAFLFAPGAIQFEEWSGKATGWLKAYVGALCASALAISCIVMPLLPPARTAEAIAWLKSFAPTKVPVSEVGPRNNLEGLADMNGWHEMAAEVDKVWMSLTPEERQHAVVYANNYGEASAIDLFSKARGLRVVGRHNNWWVWGPGDWDGSVAVVVGQVPASVTSSFDSFVPVAQLDAPLAVPEESRAQIAVARHLKMPVDRFWIKSRRID